ncbi:MAG TPA: murein biosynthesis integral membrane protein MurJ [Chloroflexota bacterium]|jgi:putative peptidoglycan lipid II flippase|nr:murein biosynthesis integral membrane protein MurJ [Chloroflexota bacterium]
MPGGQLAGDLVGAATVMMAAFLLSRVTGLLRTVAISSRFGTGPELDAYFAANRLSDTLFQVVAGGAVSAAFIPVLAGYLTRGERAEAWRMVSALFSIAVALMVPLSLLLALLAPLVVQLWGGFDPGQHDLAVGMLRILLISPTAFALGTLITSVLNAEGRFLLAALAPSAYNLGIIVGALVLAAWQGVYGLALGASLGAVLYLVIQLPGLLQARARVRPWLGLDHPGVRRVGKLMAPRTLGLAVAQLNFLVISVLASPIPGGITSLDYAWTLMMLPHGLFAMAISTAVFPTLAAQTASDQLAEMTRTLAGTLRVILYLTVPASAGLLVLGEPIVRALLERGQFGAGSTALTVVALRFYALGLLGQATVEIVTRAFYALHDTRTPVAIAALALGANFLLGLLLRPLLGHGGLALALSLASLLEAVLLVGLARRRLHGLDEARLVASGLRSLAGAAVLALALALVAGPIEGLIETSGQVERLAIVALAVGLGASVYVAATLALRSEEPRQLLGLARRSLGA